MKNWFFTLLLFVSFGVMAQENSGVIKGKILEEKSKTPIGYATVTIKMNNAVIGGDAADDKGRFEITNIPFGTLDVVFEFMGFTTKQTKIELTSKNNKIDLKEIFLQEDAQALDELVIEAEHSKIEQLVDRKVIHMGKDLTIAGASASDIMNRIPTISVDKDGNISMRGNSNVKILINGRPQNMDPKLLLKQLSTASIEKIELITNPSAKYNPEGMSGMINIVLKKNSNDGFNGMYSGNIEFAIEPKYNQNLNLNYRIGKFNFFGDFANGLGKSFSRFNVNQGDYLKQIIDVNMNNSKQNFKIGSDFYINSKNTISGYYSNFFYDGSYDLFNTNQYKSAQKVLQTDYNSSKSTTHYANLLYSHLFSNSNHKLDIEFNYNGSESGNLNKNDIFKTNNFNFQNDSDSKNKEFRANVDYVNPLSEKSTLELGGQYEFTHAESNFKSTNVSFAATAFDYNVQTAAVYATFGQKFGKLSYQLGARLEHYKVNAAYELNSSTEPFKNEFLTLYPSLFISYALSPANTLQLSANRRVDRPSISLTNPNRVVYSPTILQVGNPNLVPQFTNSVELSFTRGLGTKGYFTSGVYFRNITNLISQSLRVDDSSQEAIDMRRLIMTASNFSDTYAYGAEASFNYKLTKWWDISPGIEYYFSKQKGMVHVFDPSSNSQKINNRDVGVGVLKARFSSNFKITSQLTATLFGFYSGRRKDVVSEVAPMYKLDAGLSYSFWQNKGSLSVNFNDIFDNMKFKYTSEVPFSSEGNSRWESQSVLVGFTYAFGAKKNKKLARKNRGAATSTVKGGLM